MESARSSAASDVDPWVAELTEQGTQQEAAQARLYDLLVRVAFRELAQRASAAGIDHRDRDDLAHQAAADAMLAILDKLPTFRGESRFTTWAYKFVMLEVSGKLGRRYWGKHSSRAVTLESEDWDRFEDRMGIDPAGNAETRALATAIRRAVAGLTEHQRTMFVAVVLNGVPLDALVDRLDTNRNAIYKTIFDARRRIRAALAAEGYLSDGTATGRGQR